MENFDITKYLDMALRRKWWIIMPFLLTVLAGLTYALITPKIYEAQTLILVQAQKVPKDYVREIVSSNVEDRLRTITQQVTSRTNLEKIIQEFKLYTDPGDSNIILEEKVELFRERIIIDIARGGRGGNAFAISFSDRDPKKAMDVTNTLASNFISENLKIRESQALGTSGFLADELESVKRRLMEKEDKLKIYREKFMGGLPEQLQTNLSILERLQAQLDQLHSNLRDAENRKIIIQQRIAEAEQSRPSARVSLPDQGEEAGDLSSLKNQLAVLEAKYTQKHPDVIRLKKMIDKLKDKATEVDSNSEEEQPALTAAGQALKLQIRDIELELRSLRAELKKVNSQVKWYQAKVEETPKREQELLSLRRDYENLKELYNSLLNRKLEAEIAVSMEKKQKGEQFRVIDPAKIPIRPVKPDVNKIVLLTLVLGLALGSGLAYLKEYTDTSYKTPDEAEKELDIPILISMPIRYTDRELRIIKRKQIMAYASVGMGFVLSAIGIVLAVKGVDATINYIKSIFDNI
ncbi:MAG: protein GumC [Deltaproteobacteria bacterium]|nr:protein GumC [Deltaproteobacteria bacterium]